MIYNSFAHLRASTDNLCKRTVAVAAAADAEVIQTARMAAEQGIADFILVGDAQKIADLTAEAPLPAGVSVMDEADDAAAALTAVKLVKDGKADVLMKGLVNSSIFLKAVLDKENGLRTGRRLSHLAAFEVPGCDRLAFHTDGGMNLFPDLALKQEILESALDALHRLGMECPNVAVLAANETVNEKMPSTLDAAALVALHKEGKFPGCVIEGPVAMDVALSAEAAHHKKIDSAIAGKTDLFLVPNIEAGNLVGKTLMYCAGAKMAGVILGASHPVVMTSRAENAEGKLNSLLLACRLA